MAAMLYELVSSSDGNGAILDTRHRYP